MEDKKVRLTGEDLDLYGMLFDERDILEELESWDEGVPLSIYKHNGFHHYRLEYLKVIFGAIDENINYHNTKVTRYTTTQVIDFMDRDGNDYRGYLAETSQNSRETQQSFNCMDLGKDQLIEFITCYTESVVNCILKEEDEDSDLFYIAYIWECLQDVVYFISTDYVSNFLEASINGGKDLALKIMKDSVVAEVGTENPEEVVKGEDLYRRLADYVDEYSRYSRKKMPSEDMWDEGIVD